MTEETPKLKLKALAPPPGPPREPSSEHDVRALLRANVEHEASRPVNQPQPTPKPSRRKLRDYLLLMTLGNALLLTVFLVAPEAQTARVIIHVSAISGMAILTFGGSWVFWAVMGKY